TKRNESRSCTAAANPAAARAGVAAREHRPAYTARAATPRATLYALTYQREPSRIEDAAGVALGQPARHNEKPAAAKSPSKPKTRVQDDASMTAKLIASVYVTRRGPRRSSQRSAAA